jgi:hypothetical protein
MFHATNQIAQILTLQYGSIEESAGYGHAWIVLENKVWVTKINVAKLVASPTEPKEFIGKTDAEKCKQKELIKQCDT